MTRRLDPSCRRRWIAALAVFLAGCWRSVGPMPEEVRRDMGRVGVTAVSPQAPKVDRPWVKSEGALRGAITGAGAVAAAGGASGQGAALALPFIPVGAVLGAVTGPGRAQADAVVRERVALLRAASVALRLHEAYRADFIRVALSDTAGEAQVLPVSDRSDPAGVDTLIELTVESFGLEDVERGKNPNPTLIPFLVTRARVFHAADGRLLYEKNWSARGRTGKTLAKWAAGGEAGLGEAFAPVRRRLAGEAVEDVFLTIPIP